MELKDKIADRLASLEVLEGVLPTPVQPSEAIQGRR
jgi:hypothetical protein